MTSLIVIVTLILQANMRSSSPLTVIYNLNVFSSSLSVHSSPSLHSKDINEEQISQNVVSYPQAVSVLFSLHWAVNYTS